MTRAAPARVRAKTSWLLNQAALPANRLVAAELAAADGGRHHYVLLAALDEGGPASQADLGRRTTIDGSDIELEVWGDGGLPVDWSPTATIIELDPMIFPTASSLCGSSAGGMHASTLEIIVVRRPKIASTTAAGLPPGTRMTSGPAGSLCTRIIAVNKKRNGRKYDSTPTLTRNS